MNELADNEVDVDLLDDNIFKFAINETVSEESKLIE